MAGKPGTIELIAGELARALEPLQTELEKDNVRETFAMLGLEFPAELETQTAFVSAISAAVATAAQLPALVAQLEAAVNDGDVAAALQVVSNLGGTISSVKTSVEEIATVLNNIGGALPGISESDITAFSADLSRRLLEYMFINYLEGYHSIFLNILIFAGVVECTQVQGDPTDETKPSYLRRELKLSRISDLVSSPADYFKALYGWGDAGFNGEKLIERFYDLLFSLSVPAMYKPSTSVGVRPTLETAFVSIQPKTDIVPMGLEFVVKGGFTKGTVLELPFLFDNWNITLRMDLDAEANTMIILQPEGKITFVPPSGSVEGELGLFLAGKPVSGEEDFLIFGQAGGSRLTASRLKAGFVTSVRWHTSENKAEGDFGLEARVEKGEVVLDLSEGDSFISAIFPSDGINFAFDLLIGWKSTIGFYFGASNSLEIAIPVHKGLAGLNLEQVYLILKIGDGKLRPELSIAGNARLGPLKVSVSRVGIESAIAFEEGNLGPLDFALGFKPPNGVGLSIDAGAVKGGGYLYFDTDREEYAGALELVFSEFLTLKAIGLITTRMPDGSKGFSLLIIITAEFGSPIQLSFGFTLSAVGGLLGLHRTMRLDPLVEGVRTGAVNSVMFPTNVIENAPRIISDLREFFPPQQDIFLIGPLAKIGWGSPNLVTLSLGIIIEIPGNIAILGILKVALPDEKAKLLILQVNFLGAIEFDKKHAWLFADLYDSRVLSFTIDGQMGVLVAWGDKANFVVSVGGFHPAFNPPPLPFPVPERVSISILNKSNAKIRVEGYFAVTSNTAQFGARAEMYFGFSAFKLDGHIAFDALFQFSPFYFIITISSKLSAKVFGVGFFSVKIRGSLEGPAPWHVEGTGSISIPILPDIGVDFSHTWGNEANTTLPHINVMDLLKTEYEKIENWTAIVPAANKLLVSLREIDTTNEDFDLILHPVGTLRVSQRAVPLDITIDKVGAQKVEGANKFSLSAPEQNSGAVEMDKKADAYEKFAIAQYKEMTDSEKLNAPAFEDLKGGIEFSVEGTQYWTSSAVKRVVRYEQIIIDKNYQRVVQLFTNSIRFLFKGFLRGNAVAKSELSEHRRKQKMPFSEKIAVASTTYGVAFNTDNSPLDEQAVVFASYAQAEEYMNQKIREDANLKDSLHVIPEVEMAGVV